MRFLHTADWHVGKPLRGRSRMDEYAAALREVGAIAVDQKVDAVLVAGDIFDSPAPPPEAEKLVYDFLARLVSERIPAVLIAGNHDHPRKLGALASPGSRTGCPAQGCRPGRGRPRVGSPRRSHCLHRPGRESLCIRRFIAWLLRMRQACWRRQLKSSTVSKRISTASPSGDEAQRQPANGPPFSIAAAAHGSKPMTLRI